MSLEKFFVMHSCFFNDFMNSSCHILRENRVFFKSNLNFGGRLPKPPLESYGDLHLDLILSSNKFLFNLQPNNSMI